MSRSSPLFPGCLRVLLSLFLCDAYYPRRHPPAISLFIYRVLPVPVASSPNSRLQNSERKIREIGSWSGLEKRQQLLLDPSGSASRLAMVVYIDILSLFSPSRMRYEIQDRLSVP